MKLEDINKSVEIIFNKYYSLITSELEPLNIEGVEIAFEIKVQVFVNLLACFLALHITKESRPKALKALNNHVKAYFKSYDKENQNET